MRVLRVAIEPRSLTALDLESELFGWDVFVIPPFRHIADDRVPTGIVAELANPNALRAERRFAELGAVLLPDPFAVEELGEAV